MQHPHVVHAANLQVSPVSLSLRQNQAAEGLWLTNNGKQPLHAQVRVFRWQQRDGRDHLDSTQGLIISPPFLQIGPGQRQFIRVMRAGDASEGATGQARPTGAPSAAAALPPTSTPSPAGAESSSDGKSPAGRELPARNPRAEQAYRLIIDELPDNAGARGIQFVMRYSVPVFVQASGSTGPAAPALQWRIANANGTRMLAVTNMGEAHAQLADVSLRGPSGKSVSVGKGLLGYVLPGMTMQWPAPAALPASANQYTIEALLNGVVQKGIRPAQDPAR